MGWGTRLAALAAVLVLGGVMTWGWHWGSEDTRTCTVEDKDRSTEQAEGGSRSVYQVYTEECGVLRVKDVWLRGHTASADTFGDLEEGATYEMTTVGWRVPLLSLFPVIVTAEKQ